MLVFFFPLHNLKYIGLFFLILFKQTNENFQVEQISQLCALVNAQIEFHRQTLNVLESLHVKLQERYLIFSFLIEFR